ncbi:MAG: SBBP repeat-containing protein, partial [Candidatus Cloacimonetes bacterium]|nr:SBBP repeat-containing protein [Candidatus Cloacimonadota bacterium]
MKKTFMILILLLIAVCAFPQAPDWQWATHAGGTDVDIGYGIAIDNAGNSYVTGYFAETANFGSYSLTSGGWRSDIFVAKMDVNGNWLWATQAGGTDHDVGYGITIDDVGNIYVTGWFNDIATFGYFSLNCSGDNDIFVAKMDADGNWLWATQAGGTFYDEGNSITIDATGNCYVTGSFGDIAFFGSYFLTSSGDWDIFVAKMDVNGNWLWATQAGGTDHDFGYGITIDDSGNSYVTGYFENIAFFSSYFLIGYGDNDIFVAKMDAN